MGIKKIIFSALTSTFTYTAIGGIRFYDKNNQIIPSGSIISDTQMSGETNNMLMTSTSSYDASYYTPLHAFDTNRNQFGKWSDGVSNTAYWMSSNDNQTLTLTFKSNDITISKIEFITRPDSAYADRGLTSVFTIEAQDETGNAIKSYSITPISTVATVQTLQTPELTYKDKILLSSSDGKVRSTSRGIYSSNLIPIMTSNIAPSGEAFSSSIWNATLDSFQAFDQNTNVLAWSSKDATPLPHHIGYNFKANKLVGKYRMMVTSTYIAWYPRGWELQGSNDGLVWETLDKQTGQVFTASVYNEYEIKQPKNFSQYRLYITESIHASRVCLNVLEMVGISQSRIVGVASKSENNFINYGISKLDLASLDLTTDFAEKHYIQDVTTVLGSGKVFEHVLDENKVLKKIKFQ